MNNKKGDESESVMEVENVPEKIWRARVVREIVVVIFIFY